MSTDWGIGCRTCRAGSPATPRSAYFTGEWDNCRDPSALQKLIDAREQIVALHDRIGDLMQVFWLDMPMESCVAGGAADFLRAHAGHDLAPMTEYGTFSDDCHRYVSCCGCGSERLCRLRAGHDGECAAR